MDGWIDGGMFWINAVGWFLYLVTRWTWYPVLVKIAFVEVIMCALIWVPYATICTVDGRKGDAITWPFVISWMDILAQPYVLIPTSPKLNNFVKSIATRFLIRILLRGKQFQHDRI